MKNENFNFNIKTLDDQVMYREICKNISEIENKRFKLLWIVPLISGICYILLWLDIVNLPTIVVVIVGVFGSLITYFIFRWEKQNIQYALAFRAFAARLEARKNQHENIKTSSDQEGPFSLIDNLVKPGIFGRPNLMLKQKITMDTIHMQPGHGGGWGKTEAEAAVYITTIFLWLATVVLGLIKIYLPSFYWVTWAHLFH